MHGFFIEMRGLPIAVCIAFMANRATLSHAPWARPAHPDYMEPATTDRQALWRPLRAFPTGWQGSARFQRGIYSINKQAFYPLEGLLS